MTRSSIVALLLLVLLDSATVGAAEHPALARSRALYNAGDFDGAIIAAAVARRVPASADAAALVIARSHLERYRLRADPSDLVAAREMLALSRSASLGPREDVDLLVGLGQSLYLGELFGAAAELFDAARSHAAMLPEADRLMLLDWWATSLDREAQSRPAERRAALYLRIAERMEQELRRSPADAAANYWLAAAARGAGDVERAWDAAVAAWVRSTADSESSQTMRDDLDRLVTQALIPERVRSRPDGERPDALVALRAEWELVKQHWK
jgi:hypothetical protein